MWVVGDLRLVSDAFVRTRSVSGSYVRVDMVGRHVLDFMFSEREGNCLNCILLTSLIFLESPIVFCNMLVGELPKHLGPVEIY